MKGLLNYRTKPLTYLEVLLETLPQGIWNLMEADKLADPEHLRVISGSARVETLENGT
jgi:hypothetical protein